MESISTTCFTVLIVTNYAGTWDASIPAILYIYFKIISPIVLSLDFYRNGFGYRKVKTRPCLCAAWSYEIPFVFKGFQRYKEISLVEFSHAGLTRLIRVLFLSNNTRIRPSIFQVSRWATWSFQKASWMTSRRIHAFVFRCVDYLWCCGSAVVRAGCYNCPGLMVCLYSDIVII